jgi:hypothetical protein
LVIWVFDCLIVWLFGWWCCLGSITRTNFSIFFVPKFLSQFPNISTGFPRQWWTRAFDEFEYMIDVLAIPSKTADRDVTLLLDHFNKMYSKVQLHFTSQDLDRFLLLVRKLYSVHSPSSSSRVIMTWQYATLNILGNLNPQGDDVWDVVVQHLLVRHSSPLLTSPRLASPRLASTSLLSVTLLFLIFVHLFIYFRFTSRQLFR